METPTCIKKYHSLLAIFHTPANKKKLSAAHQRQISTRLDRLDVALVLTYHDIGSIDASSNVFVLLISLNIKWFNSLKPLFINKLKVLMHGVVAASWVHVNFASHVACLSRYPFGTGSKILELAWWILGMSY